MSQIPEYLGYLLFFEKQRTNSQRKPDDGVGRDEKGADLDAMETGVGHEVVTDSDKRSHLFWPLLVGRYGKNNHEWCYVTKEEPDAISTTMLPQECS